MFAVALPRREAPSADDSDCGTVCELAEAFMRTKQGKSDFVIVKL